MSIEYLKNFKNKKPPIKEAFYADISNFKQLWMHNEQQTRSSC